LHSPDEVTYEVPSRIETNNNVIILSFPELPEESEDRTLSIIEDMLSDLTLDLQIVQTNRVGQTWSTGRPILVKFENALNVKSFLKCKSKLRSLDKWKNVWVNSDLTKIQQTKMNSLRVTLRQKRKDMVTTLTRSSNMSKVCQKSVQKTN